MQKEIIRESLKNLSSGISLDEFDKMAKLITKKINENDFDEKKVKKNMAKYAKIEKSKIFFDTKNKSGLDYKEIVKKIDDNESNNKQNIKSTSFFDTKLKKDSNDSCEPTNQSAIKSTIKSTNQPTNEKNNKKEPIIKSFKKKDTGLVATTQMKTGGFNWSNALSNNNDNDDSDGNDGNKTNNNNNNNGNKKQIEKINSYNEIVKLEKTEKLNDFYEYKKDFHYIPKKRLEPMSSQSVYDQQKNDKLDETIKKRSKIVENLMKIEFPAQKSEEWHKLRHERITASDGGCVLGDSHYELPHKILYKKVISPPFKSNINCYNGNKYEQIATMIYSYRMNVDVEEFGLIAHPTCPFLAASPDGIISQYKLDKQHLTKYVGRMLEIKCPTSRQIKTTGEIKGDICPTHYWDQVQLQLECCDLDECDFWQCKILEYSSREEFLEDTDTNEPFRSKSSGLEKGIVIQLMPKRLPDENNEMIKFFEEYKHKMGEIIRTKNIEKKRKLIDGLRNNIAQMNLECNEFSKTILNLINDCDGLNNLNNLNNLNGSDNFNIDSFLKFDEQIKFLLRGKILKCEHSKTQYCNYWKKKDPENCKYCEAVYAYSKHIYPPKIDMTPYEYDDWVNEVITNYDEQKLLDPALNVQDYYIDRIIYWKLEQSHCVTIYRDKQWYAQALPKIQKMWSYVEYFRANPEKSKIFFDYIESLTTKSNFIKDKDEDMSEENINRILEVANILCNEKETENIIDKLKNEMIENEIMKKNKVSNYKKKYV